MKDLKDINSRVEKRERGGLNKLTASVEAESDFERLFKFLIQFDPRKRRQALLNKPVGQKLKELIFFFRRQECYSAIICGDGYRYIHKLIGIIDDDILAPLFKLFWDKDELDINKSMLHLKMTIEESKLTGIARFVPIYIPAANSVYKQRQIVAFFTQLLPLMRSVRFLIFTDESVRLLITTNFEVLKKKKRKDKKFEEKRWGKLKEDYYDAWNRLVESPNAESNDPEKNQFVIPFTNFIDDGYLLRGESLRPGEIHSTMAFTPDVHVTITGILGRMGLHKYDLSQKALYEEKKKKELLHHKKANFLFYSLYYVHLGYMVAKYPPRQIKLIEEGVKKLTEASPVPAHIFMLARLVAKYHLPINVLFSMIDVLELAHQRYHEPGAKEKFKRILQMALAMAKVGRKRGDFSLVLGRTYLFESRRRYLEEVDKLKQRAELNPHEKANLSETEALLSEKYKQLAMNQYINNLNLLINDDQAAFIFYVNGLMVHKFKKFYSSYPSLYAEWLVSEFTDLSQLLDKQIEVEDKEDFIQSEILPAFILSELGYKEMSEEDSSQDLYGMNRKYNIMDDAEDALPLKQDSVSNSGLLGDQDSTLLVMNDVKLDLDLDTDD